MEKNLSAPLVRLAMALIYIGLIGAVIVLFVIWFVAKETDWNLWIAFFAFLFSCGGGTILISKKCKCPHCGVGAGGEQIDRDYFSKIPFFKKSFCCPNCKKEIKMK